MSGSESATTAKSDEYASAEEDLSPEDGDDSRAEGVSETLKIRLLNAPHAFIRAPITQEAPCMTEDALAEREAALRAFGDDDEGRAARQRIQSDSLVSDMSAFKAANPRAVFEDFVRWHSPKDWIVSGAGEEQTDESSGRLSDRMRRDGNTWLELWTRAPRVPAHKQHPLFDPIVEGEKAMHYLETIPATALFDVAARCACAATAAILSSWWLASSEEASARAPAEPHESIKISDRHVLALFRAHRAVDAGRVRFRLRLAPSRRARDVSRGVRARQASRRPPGSHFPPPHRRRRVRNHPRARRPGLIPPRRVRRLPIPRRARVLGASPRAPSSRRRVRRPRVAAPPRPRPSRHRVRRPHSHVRQNRRASLAVFIATTRSPNRAHRPTPRAAARPLD